MFGNMIPEKRLDTANYTISNCILEIPQNIKLELSNNVLTAKAGCIFVLGGNTYSTTTNSSNLTLNIPTTQGRYVISPVGNYNLIAVDINKWGSGDTLPAQGTGTALRFFKTDERTFYNRGTVETEWGSSSVCYPICLIDVASNGVASFTKFSDGRDCIFNGMGFIGQTKYILPNVKVLQPIGKNTDGTLKSREYITDSLQLVTQGGNIKRRMFLNYNTLQITVSEWYYDEETNLWYEANENPFVTGAIFLGNCFTDGGYITDFTINQPVRTATDKNISQINTTINNVSKSAYHQPKNFTTLFAEDITSGDITLNEDFTNFEYLLFIYSNGNNGVTYSRMISSYELNILLNIFLGETAQHYCLAMQANGVGYWFIENYINGSTKTLLKYVQGVDIMFHQVIGINRKAARYD